MRDAAAKYTPDEMFIYGETHRARCPSCMAIIGTTAFAHPYRGFVIVTCNAAYCVSRGPTIAASLVESLRPKSALLSTVFVHTMTL